jgi:hypothetical protein
MLKIDRDFLRWVRPRKTVEKPFIQAPESVELKALTEADLKLEGAQDYLRGKCNVRKIRELIRKRIKELGGQ